MYFDLAVICNQFLQFRSHALMADVLLYLACPPWWFALEDSVDQIKCLRIGYKMRCCKSITKL